MNGADCPDRVHFGYSFLDCGNGRRLEDFAGTIVSRPALAATDLPSLPPAVWQAAPLRFDDGFGWRGSPPPDWRVRLDNSILALTPASGGQVGMFPEHAVVAARLCGLFAGRTPPSGGWRAISLFAHTGLVTLSLASLAGMGEIVHVDAAGSAVRRARENARLSGLLDAPVRWLIEDAVTFLRREICRGRCYDVLVADPPAHGRSRNGTWKLERDLPLFLDMIGKLLVPGGIFCLSCHRAGWTGSRLSALAVSALPKLEKMEILPLRLSSRNGQRELALGNAIFATIPT
ncbi:MAG: class I SAM-dependent methyltransferase [Planctomycetota bacterium]|nr:class I SAM-dependent methyltransferase [Planctomycetota bacterium]